MKGSGSHKVLDLSANPILRHYYHNKVSLNFYLKLRRIYYNSFIIYLFFIVCVGRGSFIIISISLLNFSNNLFFSMIDDISVILSKYLGTEFKLAFGSCSAHLTFI